MKILTIIALSLLILSCSKPESDTAVKDIASVIDTLIQKKVDSTQMAGAVVGVFKGNDKIFLKSYGYADLEFEVRMPVDASFEIGSVTKQFTAAALLQLVEQGKVNLGDDFTKYVKFDTKGKHITVRQLLNHTSGIKGYTEIPEFGDLMVKKLDRDTLLRIVEKKDFDFNPGEALIYNNTAFFIAGLVIEKASGQKYEDYIGKNLFEKAGMTHSYYCSESKITKTRAHGYDGSPKGLKRAIYLDHQWPFAAGSICSTVEDLNKWNQALHHGNIISETMYKEFLSPAKLINGATTHYAKGITVRKTNGKTMLEHGGGIPGFLSE
ncbi:MAG: serine hydrolase domain-containing protein, partial [Chryseolinea sp.]